jgi:tetratricopeptide (TPR) repeat protein
MIQSAQPGDENPIEAVLRRTDVNVEPNRKRAQELYEMGTRRLMEGRVAEAIQLYEESIQVKPTAEGYTFRGWAVSYLGDLDQAIEDCKRAIRLDPDFGNPYNDIRVYLMQKGRLDDAIPWLESAKRAKRYEARHYPYLNLGRVYIAKGDEMRALDEFVKALDIHPDDADTLQAIKKIRYTVN